MASQGLGGGKIYLPGQGVLIRLGQTINHNDQGWGTGKKEGKKESEKDPPLPFFKSKIIYLILLTAAITFWPTALGIWVYSNSVLYFWPVVKIHLTKAFMSLAAAGFL